MQFAGGYAQFKTLQEVYELLAQKGEDPIRHEIKGYIVELARSPARDQAKFIGEA